MNRESCTKDCGGEKPVLVDVRSTEEFVAGPIDGAINGPADQLASRIDELPPDANIVTSVAWTAHDLAEPPNNAKILASIALCRFEAASMVGKMRKVQMWQSEATPRAV